MVRVGMGDTGNFVIDLKPSEYRGSIADSEAFNLKSRDH